MRKHYFLGLAVNQKKVLRYLFARGSERDLSKLKFYLEKKYSGQAILCKNGRSGLALALKAYFDKGDAVIVNGFTCFAVFEAVKAAGLKPVFADISGDDLNFDIETLKKALANNANQNIKGIIVQNSLGNPVDMEKIEKFAAKHELLIIEDLAHCAGVKYPDGREAGTVGVATALSFGKEKSIDTISGGAVILREPILNEVEIPNRKPALSDRLRARFYPLLGAICRGLSYVHLGGALMRGLIKIHWVEKSADNKLDLDRTIAKFEAKFALEQLKALKKSGEKPLRKFYLVKNREELLEKLKASGYYFDGFWYEKPVSPIRYYNKVHFPENDCPVAVEVCKKIINIPTYYSDKELENALKIVEEYKDGR